jgi:SOS-response transcriptional repressor LexA
MEQSASMPLAPRPGSVRAVDLSSRLRAAIAALGYTQSWVAVRSNVPEETISRIVTGDTKNPQVGTLLKIAPVLGVTVGWLLGERTAPLTSAEATIIARAIEILKTRIDGGSGEAKPNAVAVARAPEARIANAEVWPEILALPEAPVPREAAMRGATVIFRAEGDAMRACGILAGDRLFVRPVDDVRQAIDEIVVCRFAGDWHARRLTIAGDRIHLVSGNEHDAPITVDEKSGDFVLFGIVVARAGEL